MIQMSCRWGLFLVVLLCSASAHAKGNVQAKAKAAKKACAAGDFRRGVEILAELYVESNDTTYIFNQGRCYEQNHQWQAAVDRFREYLRNSREITAEARETTEQHISECKRLQQEETPVAPPAPAEVAPSTSTPAPLPPTPLPPPPAAVPDAHSAPTPVSAPTPAAQRGDGFALRVGGLVVGGLGLVAVAAGVYMNLIANDYARQASEHANETASSRQKSYMTGSIVGYATGGVLLVTGTVLYLIGSSRDSSGPRPLALIPSLSPEGAGLLLQGQF